MRTNTEIANDSSPPVESQQPPIGVAMFIQQYYPFIGGAERQLQALTRVFPSLGVRTLIFTRRLVGAGYAPTSVIEGARIYRVRLFGGHVLRSLSYTAGVLRLVIRHRRAIDILHAHELLSPATTAVAAKLFIRRPVVVKVLQGGERGEIPRLLAKPFGRTRMALFRRSVDRFICISEEIVAQLRAQGIPEEKLVRIPNGVDTELYAPLAPEERGRLRASLGLPAGPLVIFTGRLVPEKGLGVLADAWSSVLAQVPDAHLIVLGEGPEREMLAARELPRMHLLGPQQAVMRYLQCGDVFVLPSEREGLSNALLEAMATGLGCVATRVGGAPDLITDGVSGWLVPPGDATALAAELVRALGDGDARARAGHAAREYVRAHHALRSIAEQYLAMYRSVLAEPTREERSEAPLPGAPGSPSSSR
jgi:glycosyltransferase involved in cell wall biosynthesis